MAVKPRCLAAMALVWVWNTNSWGKASTVPTTNSSSWWLSNSKRCFFSNSKTQSDIIKKAILIKLKSSPPMDRNRSKELSTLQNQSVQPQKLVKSSKLDTLTSRSSSLGKVRVRSTLNSRILTCSHQSCTSSTMLLCLNRFKGGLAGKLYKAKAIADASQVGRVRSWLAALFNIQRLKQVVLSDKVKTTSVTASVIVKSTQVAVIMQVPYHSLKANLTTIKGCKMEAPCINPILVQEPDFTVTIQVYTRATPRIGRLSTWMRTPRT